MEIHYYPLSSKDIASILNSNEKCKGLFCGVYAADTLPKKFSKPAAIIVNTDKQNAPGQHWVAMYFDTIGNCEYFDSFGLPPYIPDHVNFIRKHGKQGIMWGKSSLQGLESSVCGHYTCMYVLGKANNIDINTFVRAMNVGTPYDNDAHIIILFMKYFSKSLCRYQNTYSEIIMHCIKRCACALTK
jgi:hypothetical protein